MISAKEIVKLRLKTGAGVMDCKQALEKAKGDFDKAQEILENNAQVIAQKKAERSADQGLVECYCHNGKIGVILEIGCESDFVVRNADFKKLAHELALQIASMNPKNVEELLSGLYIRDESLMIKNLIDQTIAKMGENIQIKRFVRYELGEK